MWHIIATVCFFDLSVPELEKACFPNAYFPTGYPTEEHCMKVAQGIIDLLNDENNSSRFTFLTKKDNYIVQMDNKSYKDTKA